MKERNEKRAQIDLSFGMIFSIILIICFVVFAFYVINNLLRTKGTTEAAIFAGDLQDKVNEFWTSSGGSETTSFNVPQKTEKICFIDFSSPSTISSEIYEEFERISEKENDLIFYPRDSAKGFNSVKIDNINLEQITATENPYCIPTKDSKVTLKIKKDFNEKLVMITR